eukprot:Opistho-2@12916
MAIFTFKRFLAGAAGVGAYFAYGKYEERAQRRLLWKQAVVLGDVLSPIDAKPRRLTVILNPVAGKRNAQYIFDRDVAPILNLAAIDYGIVETERIGHARDMATLLDVNMTDGVVLVGGDGIAHEFFAGLLSRDDAASVASTLPVGVIPTGTCNAFYAHAFGESTSAGQTALAIARAQTRQEDVLEISTDDGRRDFAVNLIAFGALGGPAAATRGWFPRFRYEKAALRAMFTNAFETVDVSLQTDSALGGSSAERSGKYAGVAVLKGHRISPTRSLASAEDNSPLRVALFPQQSSFAYVAALFSLPKHIGKDGAGHSPDSRDVEIIPGDVVKISVVDRRSDPHAKAPKDAKKPPPSENAAEESEKAPVVYPPKLANLDGERADNVAMTVRVRPNAIRLFSPEKEAS